MQAPPGGAFSLPRVLVGVGALALAARLLFFLQLGDTPFGRTAFLDASYYDAWAQRIAAGDWLGGEEPFFVEPGYLYLLAALRRLGADLTLIRLVQAFIGAGTAILTALLTVRLSGSVVGAAIAGTAVALYGPLVHFEGQLLKTTFEVFAATAALAIAIAPRWRPLALGAASGAALVLKSNFAVIVPLLLAFGAWRVREEGRRAMAAAVAWMLVGTAPFVAATMLRNGVASGEALVLPWSSGINFYIGNGPHADGLDPTLPFAEVGPADEGRAGKAEAERRAGRPLGYAESSDFWWAETWRSIGRDPARAARLLLDKTRLALSQREFTDNVSFYFVRDRTPVLFLLFGGAWLAVPLGLAGLAGAAFRRDPGRWLVGAYLLLQVAGIVAFHVIDRYRLALVPAAVALGVTALADRSRGGGAPRALLAGALAIGLAVAVVLPPPVGAGGQNMAGHHRMLAIDAMERGDFTLAVTELESAVELNPRVQAFWLRLAVAQRLAGDVPGAERSELRGLALDPARGPLSLGLLLAPYDAERAARFCRRAAESGDRVGAALYCSGEALHRAGRTREAAAALTEAVAYAPRFFDAWLLLGDVRSGLGDHAGARQAWQAAAALRPDDAALRERLGEGEAPITRPAASPRRAS